MFNNSFDSHILDNCQIGGTKDAFNWKELKELCNSYRISNLQVEDSPKKSGSSLIPSAIPEP